MKKKRMSVATFSLLCFLAWGVTGCGSGGSSGQNDAGSSTSLDRTASLVGSIAGLSARAAGRLATDGAAGACPGISVTVDPPSPIDLEFDEDCQLFVTEIPVGTVTMTIEVDGITGAITLEDVSEGEVVEIEVLAGVGALDIHVLRWIESDEGALPEIVNDNDVSIELAAGYYRQTLTVNGDDFELLGAGCSDQNSESTVVAGAVVINGNDAFINGVKFLAPVTVRGSNVQFQSSCFEGGILVLADDSPDPDDDTPPADETPVCEELIDFENLVFQTAVERPGTVHPYLEISTEHRSRGGVVVVAEGTEPTLYTGPQVAAERVPNGCLGNPGAYATEGSLYGQGFADLDGVHDYVFTILDGKSVSFFEVTMLDFGDFNPELVRDHKVELVAYTFREGQRVVIDRDDRFAYQSLAEELPSTPTDPDQGDLQITGDACTAQPGDPGNFTFRVAGSGITHVALLVKAGPDPQIVFDNIRFQLEQLKVGINVIPTINLKSNGVIPVAIEGDACFDVGAVDPSTVEFGPAGARPKHLKGLTDEEDNGDDDSGGEQNGDSGNGCEEDEHLCDRDGDAVRDWLFHFSTQDTGILPNDQEACLSGLTHDGRLFHGCDSIRIAPGATKGKPK